MKKNSYRPLEQTIGYRFRRKEWLEAALTHPSWRHEKGPDTREADNQRLEFLGDAALGFVVAADYFHRLPERPEGELTQMRARLVGATTLAEQARRLELGTWLRLGKGEENSGGRDRDSNLADALEAVFGAAWCDGGMKAVEKIYQKVFGEHTGPDGEVTLLADHINAKGTLQEHLQGKGWEPPTYRVLQTLGPDHDRTYQVEVLLGEQRIGEGSGTSIRHAEAQAAADALQRIDQILASEQ